MAEEQDDLTVVYLWARKESEDEIKALRADVERLREALHAIVASDWKNGVCADIARAALGEDLA